MMKMKSRFLKHNNACVGMSFFKKETQKMRDKVQDGVQRDCNNKFYIQFVEIRNYSFEQRNNILSNIEYSF